MIGERLKKLRKERRMKQEELAEIAGVQKTTISMYETNRSTPSDPIKVKVAKHFNVSLDYLLGTTDEPVPIYSKDDFILIPKELQEGEKKLLHELVDLIQFRNENG